ncbi:hypothetical protein [Pedobacter endophyticus]|uniref:Uncharacterized protein n=1 Tax=Pedobacter endophyticus TaxID=2789740 RepID=A0A7U3SQS3_9SPHI|nr:hypothetical protein [Pedobacter endophyticus]QPH38651.1 hypothetical protein IZT61_16430 [Pedobacter endophyticus]
MYTTVKKVSKGLMAAALGLVLVFGGSAFKADSKRVQYTFKYNSANKSKAQVETLSNWIYDPSAAGCNEVQQEACIIHVDQAYVNTSGTPTLDPSLNLVATAFNSSRAYVSSSDDDTMEIENRTAQ